MLGVYDDVSVCNIGLSRLGEEPIKSFEDNTDIAALCGRLYPSTVQSILSSHDWNFAKAKRRLGLSAERKPLNRWENAFKLPENMVAGPWAVYADGGVRPAHDYEIIGDYLCCNYSDVLIDFREYPPEDRWPGYFVALVGAALEAEFAEPITASNSKVEMAYRKAYGSPGERGQGGAFATAKYVDAQTQPLGTLFDNGDPFTGVR